MLAVAISFLALGVLAVATCGYFLEQHASERDYQRLASTADFVTLADGAKIRVVRGGEDNKGGPTLVFDSGVFDISSDWNHILPEVAKFARVFAYDRPGTGLSDRISDRDDAIGMAENLHRILAAAGLEPPYMLVGHSLGGCYALVFASRYPKEVAALALIEPMHPDEFERQTPDATAGDKRFARKVAAYGFLSRFGLARLTGAFRDFGAGLADSTREEIDALNRSHRHLAGVAAEMAAYDLTKDQVRAITSLGDLPLGILSVKQPDDANTKAYQAMHHDMLALSQRSFQELADGDHASIIHNRKDSAASVALIKRVFDMLPSQSNPAK